MLEVLKNISKTIKILVLLATLLLFSSHSKLLETKVSNINLNKSLDLAIMSKMISDLSAEDLAYSLELPSSKIEDKNQDEQILAPLVQINTSFYKILNTVAGELTGYVYNCPLCSKKLACLSSLDLSTGNVYYEDNIFGRVRIVASSKDLPCGSIVSFKSNRISEELVLAIVLDRGVPGTTLDLLVETENYAFNNVGRSNIIYNILRYGWEG